MQQLPFKALFVGFSVFWAVGCGKSGPLVDVCVSDPERNGLQCVDKKQRPYFLTYSQSDSYVAVSPDDFGILLNYCGLKGVEAKSVIQYVVNRK